MPGDLQFTLIKPDRPLSPFVESYWQVYNNADTNKEIIIVPDGRIDLTFSLSSTETIHITQAWKRILCR